MNDIRRLAYSTIRLDYNRLESSYAEAAMIDRVLNYFIKLEITNH